MRDAADVTLPDLSGLDLQQRIADRVHMPIIFITGHGDVPMAVRAKLFGFEEDLTQVLMVGPTAVHSIVLLPKC